MLIAYLHICLKNGQFYHPPGEKVCLGAELPRKALRRTKGTNKTLSSRWKNFEMLTTQVERGYQGRHCGGGGGEKEVVGQSDPAEEKLFWREEEKSLCKEGKVEVGRRWWRGRRCRCETFFFWEPTPFPSISWPRPRRSTFCEEKKSPAKVVHSSGRRGQANEMDPVKPEEAEYSDSPGWRRLVASQKGPIDLGG